jgi:Probable transposase
MHTWRMPRRRDVGAGPVVHRTARLGLRLTHAQRQRCFGLLRSAGDVWACVLEISAWRRRRGDPPQAGYQQWCRLLTQSGPGTFGELPVASYPAGQAPDPQRVAGVDLGIIHPYAVAAPGTEAPGTEDSLLVSGRAIRAEHRLHLADTKGRRRATATRAPTRGRRGSRRWRKTRRRAQLVEGRHRRRVRQALHEATTTVIDWAVARRIGTLTVGDPRGVLDKPAGRVHNLRLRQRQIGRTLQLLQDKQPSPGSAFIWSTNAAPRRPAPPANRKSPNPAAGQ